MATTELTRDYEGATIPAAGTYVFDTAHSSVNFSVRHMMVAKVRGHFAAPTGTFVISVCAKPGLARTTKNAAPVSAATFLNLVDIQPCSQGHSGSDGRVDPPPTRCRKNWRVYGNEGLRAAERESARRERRRVAERMCRAVTYHVAGIEARR